MSREWRFFLADAIRFCERVQQYTAGLDRHSFEKDSKTYDATLRNLELIGEAVRQIPEDVKQQRPEIPWRNIVATRNYLTHVYFGVDNDIIWDVVTQRLVPLLEALRAIEFETIDGDDEPYKSGRSAPGN